MGVRNLSGGSQKSVRWGSEICRVGVRNLSGGGQKSVRWGSEICQVGVRNLSGGGQKSVRWESEICQVGVRNLSGGGQKSVRIQNYQEKACPPPPQEILELLHSLTQVGFEVMVARATPPPSFLQGISSDIQLS